MLDVGNSLVAVKGETRIDMQYVQFVDVTAAQQDLIEFARAVLERY